VRGISGLMFEFPQTALDAGSRFRCAATAAGVVVEVTFRLRTQEGAGLKSPESWTVSSQKSHAGTTFFEASFRDPANVALAFQMTCNGIPLAFQPQKL